MTSKANVAKKWQQQKNFKLSRQLAQTLAQAANTSVHIFADTYLQILACTTTMQHLSYICQLVIFLVSTT